MAQPWRSGSELTINTALKCSILFRGLPCHANILALWQLPLPLDQPLLQWVRTGFYLQIFPEFKLTLAEKYKNRTVKRLPQGISDSHGELVISDAASLNFSLKTSWRHGEAKEESHDKTQKTRTDIISSQKLRRTETKLKQIGGVGVGRRGKKGRGEEKRWVIPLH